MTILSKEKCDKFVRACAIARRPRKRKPLHKNIVQYNKPCVRVKLYDDFAEVYDEQWHMLLHLSQQSLLKKLLSFANSLLAQCDSLESSLKVSTVLESLLLMTIGNLRQL
jgi:hypothetical protein